MWFKIILISILGLTSSVISSFDLRGAVNGNRMGSIPLGMSLGIGELDVEGVCNRPGMACLNCTTAVTCVRLPVGWLRLPLEECAEGLTCNAHLGQCSEEPVPECEVRSQEFEHSCEQVGIFPDAYDCRKFHLCSPPDGMPDGRPADHRAALCPRHYGYNPMTAQCSVQLLNGQCAEKVAPDCTNVGEFKVLPSSVNHYYVCVMKQGVLYPQILICPHGEQFWDDGFCRPEPRPQRESSHLDSNGSSSSESRSTEESTLRTKDQYVPSEAPTTSRIESFFSTDKATTYPVDTFLADKFDLSNYESVDDTAQVDNNDFINSFENNDW